MKDRKNYITLLSVISAIAVVILHCNSCFHIFSKERYWLTSLIITRIFYFAVPVFFMITGVTLIDYQKKYSTKEYFKKRINKTFIPFVLWSLIGLLFLIYFEKTISIQSIDIKYIFNGIFSTSFTTIYWFFIPLFIIYLCIPLFGSVDDSKKESAFKYLCIVGIIFNISLPFINNVFKLELVLPINVIVVSGYLIYPLLGYLLDKKDFNRKERIIIYILGIVGLLMHIIGTYKLSMDAGKIVETYLGYTNIPCVLYSIGVFIFIKNISGKITKYDMVNFIGKYTFPIYLMHWYFWRIIVKSMNLNIYNIFVRMFLPFVIIFACVLVTNIIRKISLIKKILP